MKRIAYIIPGYGESHKKQKGYKRLAELLSKNGIVPVQVDIEWKKESPASFKGYTEQFLTQFKKERGTKVYVLGFSYGATIAFLTAAKTKPAKTILCSLSPYFTEDHKNLESRWIRWWQKNFTESDYEFAKLAPKIITPVQLVVGSDEHHSVLKRARAAQRNLKNASLTVARGAKHNIGQKEYLAALERLIAKLD